MTELTKKGQIQTFSLTGKVMINNYTFKLNEKSKNNPNYIYNQLSLSVNCGKNGTINAEMMGGYNIQLRNPLIELQPSVFLLTDMQSFHADITARLEYNKMFNGGISYRVNESVGVMFGVKIGRFQAGYAYDFPITALGRASSGSHELCLRYAMKLNKTKTGKNRHKSVRIL